MRTQRTHKRGRPHALVLGGYGAALRVEAGHLVAEGEVNGERQTRRFSRARHGLASITVVSQHGAVSLAAIRWAQGTGVPITCLDRDGRPLASVAAARRPDGRFRRAQAAAVTNGAGLAVAKMLITRKIRGQIANLELLDADPDPLSREAATVENARTLDQVRLAESVAADWYWRSWTRLEVKFVKADLPRIPIHWMGFQQRSSPIASGPRLAVDPPNCLVNYLAGVLEAATRVVCSAIGVDESLAIIHADVPARSSMVFDVCEPCRPEIERFIIQLIDRHVFSWKDFAELPSGACRVLPPLRDALAATGPQWLQLVAPHVEETAAIIADHAGLPAPPTLASNERRRAAHSNKPANPAAVRAAIHPACIECGSTVPPGRRRCPDCHRNANTLRLAAQTRTEVSRRSVTGDHPTKRSEVRAKIAATQKRHANDVTSGGSGYAGAASEFERLIRQRLVGLRAAYIAREVGVSVNYARDVRDGRRTPRLERWPDFQLAALRGHERKR